MPLGLRFFVLACVAISITYVINKGNNSSDVIEHHDVKDVGSYENTLEVVTVHPNMMNSWDHFRNAVNGFHEEFKNVEDNTSREKRSLYISQPRWNIGTLPVEEHQKLFDKRSDKFSRIFFGSSEVGEANFGKTHNENGQQEQVYQEDSKQKRSLANGRAQWRPGKRSIPFLSKFDSGFGSDSGYDLIITGEVQLQIQKSHN